MRLPAQHSVDAASTNLFQKAADSSAAFYFPLFRTRRFPLIVANMRPLETDKLASSKGSHMPHIFSQAKSLEGSQKVGDGNCVALVQHFTKVGHTSTWRPGVRVLDASALATGTVIATFVNGRYPNRPKGNHAALFLYAGPRDRETGKPSYIAVMDQWTSKPKISARSIIPRGAKTHAQGNRHDDSDNADHFYVVL
ncbi:BPSL0067 family protein [Massilia agri]